MDKYALIDGLVYRKMNDQSNLLYVPAEMEENIIRASHEKVGHQSVDKTVAGIRLHYWFPRMHSKVKTHIDNCIKCIAYAAPARITERNLYNIPKKPIPFDTIHIDHFGPLPSLISKSNH